MRRTAQKLKILPKKSPSIFQKVGVGVDLKIYLISYPAKEYYKVTGKQKEYLSIEQEK